MLPERLEALALKRLELKEYFSSVTESEARQYVDRILKPIGRMYLDGIQTQSQEKRSAMQGIREDISQQFGITPSRTYITALFVLAYMADQFEQLAIDEGNRGKPLTYAVFADSVFSVDVLMKGIINAEGGLREDNTPSYLEAIHHAGTLLSVEFSPDTVYSSLADQQREEQRVLESLKKDPTGIEAISSTVKTWKRNPKLLPEFVIPTFAIAGAEFTEKYYKAVYRLSRP